MVGYDPKERQLRGWEYTAAGAVSGFITRGLTQPLDVLKIRFQLQLEPIRHSSTGSKYRGMYHCFKTMVMEETVRSLWKGHVPAQFLSVMYASVQFGAYEWLTRASSQLLPLPESLNSAHSTSKCSTCSSSTIRLLQNFVCGGLAAAAAVVVSQPADVIRTRLSGQGEPKVYKSVTHAVATMLMREGPSCFLRGLSANLAMCVPQAAIQFGIFNACVQASRSVAGMQERSGSQSFSCGAVSGVCAKLIIYPFDVAKKRLQVVGFEEARRSFGATRYYSGTMNCIAVVIEQEGLRGIYKGISWALLKAGITTSLYFVTYDVCCRLLRASTS